MKPPVNPSGSAAVVNQHPRPIPAPSYWHQYRAIGLLYGHYQPSPDRLTKGTILTPAGLSLDAVILGRAICLCKKHLDLNLPHLWVVYPRTGAEQGDDCLHLQIVGVWEPQTLHQEQVRSLSPQDAIFCTSGYFSIRGEVIFSSPATNTVIVKIRQSPRQPKDKTKFFKLKLQGCLPPYPVKRFWDLQVHLQGKVLVLQTAIDLGLNLPKKTAAPKPGHKLPRPLKFKD